MNLTLEERRALWVLCYQDPALFCQRALPHWFPKPLGWLQLGCLAILLRKAEFLLSYPEALQKIEAEFVQPLDPDDPSQGSRPIFEVTWTDDGVPVHITLRVSQFTLLIIPRGFSKTTLANAATLYKIAYKETEFTLEVSKSSPHAKMQLGTITTELELNDFIRQVYGNLVPDKRDGQKWTEEFAETNSGVSIAARGRGGQVRGLLTKGKRPDNIVFDDIEDEESVSTEDQREKDSRWFYGTLKPCLPRPGVNPNATMTGLGTMLHAKCLLVVLMHDPAWTVIRFGALDSTDQPTFPLMMTREQLDLEKSSYVRAGKLEVFYLEYFNQIRSVEASKFKPSYIIHRAPRLHIARAMAIDPAISNSERACKAAIAVIGLEADGSIGVIDIWSKRGATAREQVDQYFRLSKAFDVSPNLHGVESIAFQAALSELLREEMFRRGYFFEITPIKHVGKHPEIKKERRIEAVLQPRYANGAIYHCRRFPSYETALLDWPNCDKDETDAVAMAVRLLDPYAAAAAGDYEDLVRDSYDPLDDSWRAPV